MIKVAVSIEHRGRIKGDIEELDEADPACLARFDDIVLEARGNLERVIRVANAAREKARDE